MPKKKESDWFVVHRVLQITVVVLTLVGFALAVYMTEDEGVPHFGSLHQQLGLTLTIIAVIQPLNALIRPQETQSSQPQPTPRLVWEVVHKVLGYGGWILSQYTIHLGIKLVCDQVDGDLCGSHSEWYWTGFVVLVYLILWSLTQLRTLKSNLLQEDAEPRLVANISTDGRTDTGAGAKDEENVEDGGVETQMTKMHSLAQDSTTGLIDEQQTTDDSPEDGQENIQGAETNTGSTRSSFKE